MWEFLIQFIGVIAVLMFIVWMVQKKYDEQYSEYGKLLDEIPDSYAHLDDKALQEEIVRANKVLHRLESELSTLESDRRARRHRLKKKIAAIKLALLHSEQTRRNRQAQF